MDKCCIIGAFDFTEKDTGGQPVKTREFYRLLSDQYGKENVFPIETLGWKRNPIKLIGKIFAAAKKCDTMIMLPAHNGVEIFGRILAGYKKRKNKKIYYNVIGGWLAEKLEKEPKLKKVLREFDGIWVETQTMKKKLEAQEFCNISIIPNFKRLTPIGSNEIKNICNPPYKLCTFSRVCERKGIEDAVRAVEGINKEADKTVYTLDIYGQIDESEVEWWENLKSGLPEYISYKGVADPSKSVEIIRDYFALLFPTKFYTEGIPGTIIDAYFSAVPVISSRWLSFCDVVREKETGYGYEFNNPDKLFELLKDIASNPEMINSLRVNCLGEAKNYTPEAAVEILTKSLR